MKLYKKLISTAVLSMALIGMGRVTAHAQHMFTINGQLAPDVQGKVVLIYKSHALAKADTATVINGKFVFKGDVGDPVLARLSLNPPVKLSSSTFSQYDPQSFFLEGEAYTVSGEEKMKAGIIKGGKAQADFSRYTNLLKPLQEKAGALNLEAHQYKKENNDTALLRVQKAFTSIQLEEKRLDSTFTLENRDSYVAFDLWRHKHPAAADPALASGFSLFSKAIQQTVEGKRLAARIATAKTLAAGQPAPDFTLTDTIGKPITLSSLKGKNVLLFFWTTDFVGIENFAFDLGRLNRTLRDKNFVIVGVYYENTNKGRNTLEYVRSALQEYTMNGWVTLTDIGGIGKNGAVSQTAKAYGLESPADLMQAYLIGPDGKITTRNISLADKDLAQTLEPMLNSNPNEDTNIIAIAIRHNDYCQSTTDLSRRR